MVRLLCAEHIGFAKGEPSFMRMKDKTLRDRNGFTLLEVLLTIVLVSWGLAFLLQAVSAGLFATGINEQELVAVNLAQEKAEEIGLKSYADLVNEAKAPVPGFPAFKREVKVTIPQAGLKQAEIDAYWIVSTGENKASLTTYVSDK